MADQEYSVKIATQGDPSGANKVAEALRGVGHSAGDTGEEVDHLAEAFKKAGEAKSDALVKRLEEIKAAAEGAAAELERVLDLQTRLNKAKSEAELAANEASDATNTTKELRRADIEDN